MCASAPFTHLQIRSRRAFPPCFAGMCGWVFCAKNWQLILEEWRAQRRHHDQKRLTVNGPLLAQFLEDVAAEEQILLQRQRDLEEQGLRDALLGTSPLAPQHAMAPPLEYTTSSWAHDAQDQSGLQISGHGACILKALVCPQRPGCVARAGHHPPFCMPLLIFMNIWHHRVAYTVCQGVVGGCNALRSDLTPAAPALKH